MYAYLCTFTHTYSIQNEHGEGNFLSHSRPTVASNRDNHSSLFHMHTSRNIQCLYTKQQILSRFYEQFS